MYQCTILSTIALHDLGWTVLLLFLRSIARVAIGVEQPHCGKLSFSLSPSVSFFGFVLICFSSLVFSPYFSLPLPALCVCVTVVFCFVRERTEFSFNVDAARSTLVFHKGTVLSCTLFSPSISFFHLYYYYYNILFLSFLMLAF